MKAMLVTLGAALPLALTFSTRVPAVGSDTASCPAVSGAPSLEPASTDVDLRYEGSCGFAGSGTQVYLVNHLRNRRVRVTIRKYWKRGIDDGHCDATYVLPAGGEKSLGCSRSNNLPLTSYRYEVVGCERL